MPAARGDISDVPEQYKTLHEVYSETNLKARYMESGDFYMNLEIMLHKVWDETASIEDAYTSFKDYVTTTMNLSTK